MMDRMHAVKHKQKLYILQIHKDAESCQKVHYTTLSKIAQWTVVLPQTDGKISTSALMQSTGENADCCCSSLNESLDYSAFQPSTFPSTAVVFNSFDC